MSERTIACFIGFGCGFIGILIGMISLPIGIIAISLGTFGIMLNLYVFKDVWQKIFVEIQNSRSVKQE